MDTDARVSSESVFICVHLWMKYFLSRRLGGKNLLKAAFSSFSFGQHLDGERDGVDLVVVLAEGE